MSRHEPYTLTAAGLAEVDQTRAALLEMAARAAREGANCCGHPLCPGDQVLQEVVETFMGSPNALILTTGATMRMLGDLTTGEGGMKAGRRGGAPVEDEDGDG